MHDMETMRSAAGLSSSLVAYFVNNSLNKHGAMSACMDSIAEKVRIASTLLREPCLQRPFLGHARLSDRSE